MFQELFAEFLAQEGFFAAGLEIETGEYDGEAEAAAQFSLYESGAHERQQNAGVNGMANPAVEAGAD